jgi:hypothetical protein
MDLKPVFQDRLVDNEEYRHFKLVSENRMVMKYQFLAKNCRFAV